MLGSLYQRLSKAVTGIARATNPQVSRCKELQVISTCVVTELLEVFGSFSLALTSTRLVIVPGSNGACTTMVTCRLFPEGKLPRLQVTTPSETVQVGAEGEEERKSTAMSRVSSSCMFVAREGPLLVMVMV